MTNQPQSCSNCHHAYGAHDGWHMLGVSRKDWTPRWGEACGFALDGWHTCGCPRYSGPPAPPSVTGDGLRALVEAALTSEDEIAHGEAWSEERGGLARCAYCDGEWPCRTQRGIARLLAALSQPVPEPCISCFEGEHDIDYHDHHSHGDRGDPYIGPPHSQPVPEPGLDVERLARAFDGTNIGVDELLTARECAEQLAAEYDRLSAMEEKP